MKKELIVFDFDDTLNRGGTEVMLDGFRHALTEVGVDVTREAEMRVIADKWGSTHNTILQELLKESPETLYEACKAYQDYIDENYVERVEPISGSVQLLGRLASKHTLALATAAEPNVLNKTLDHFEIPKGTFSEIITSYDVDPTRVKPDPFTLYEIMKRTRKSRSQTAMVGDSSPDVQMARAAGVDMLVVLTGHIGKNLEQLDELKIDEKSIIEDVTQLEEAISRLNFKPKNAVVH